MLLENDRFIGRSPLTRCSAISTHSSLEATPEPPDQRYSGHKSSCSVLTFDLPLYHLCPVRRLQRLTGNRRRHQSETGKKTSRRRRLPLRSAVVSIHQVCGASVISSISVHSLNVSSWRELGSAHPANRIVAIRGFTSNLRPGATGSTHCSVPINCPVCKGDRSPCRY